MRLLLTFDYYADIIDVPPRVIDDLAYFKNGFYDWLYDKSNHHAYWISDKGEHDGSQDAVMYGSEAFLEWLNTYALTEGERAALVTGDLDEWDDVDLPSMWF